MLEKKLEKGLTWEEIGRVLGRNPVYAAMLVYGYAQASKDEADRLSQIFELSEKDKKILMTAPYRTPSQPWPPTDPFVYRLYEVVLLYGPVIKDVAHELFGDGIMSAIDMTIDLKKIEDPPGVPRMLLTLNGKWLYYKKW